MEAETKRPPFPRRHFHVDFLNGNVSIAIEFSLNFVPKGPINNDPALAQIAARCRPSDKPLSEAMMTHISTDAYMRRLNDFIGAHRAHSTANNRRNKTRHWHWLTIDVANGNMRKSNWPQWESMYFQKSDLAEDSTTLWMSSTILHKS